MKICLETFILGLVTVTKKHLSIFSSNSEANASELPENLDKNHLCPPAREASKVSDMYHCMCGEGVSTFPEPSAVWAHVGK